MPSLFNRFGAEVLSLNARALDYTTRANVQLSIRLANDKLETKRLLQKAGLNVPRLFATIRNRAELKRFRWTKLPSSFVLKPNSSSGGGGIMVIFGRNKKGNWVRADKTEVFIPQLKDQVLDILDGNFSRSNDSSTISASASSRSPYKSYFPDVMRSVRSGAMQVR